MDDLSPASPIVVTISIDTPQGSMTITKTQQFVRGMRNRLPGPMRPAQSLSQVFKEAVADANPWVRKHDTVVG